MCARAHVCVCTRVCVCEVYPPAKSAKLQNGLGSLCVCVGYVFANAANTPRYFAKFSCARARARSRACACAPPCAITRAGSRVRVRVREPFTPQATSPQSNFGMPARRLRGRLRCRACVAHRFDCHRRCTIWHSPAHRQPHQRLHPARVQFGILRRLTRYLVV